MSNSNSRNRDTNGNRNFTIGAANFDARFVSNTRSRFCTNFVNGCDIDLLENCNAIHLEDDSVYLVSYSYTLRTEEEGKLEIIPVLGGIELSEGRTTVLSCREGTITATNTFTLETSMCSCLTFFYRACEAETGERPEGQISIVALGRIREDKRNHGGCECGKKDKCETGGSGSSSSSSDFCGSGSDKW